jgi:phage shock protein A
VKLIKKFAVNIHSCVESIIDRFENKEALSIAYIREYERVVARAKVKSAQIEREVVRLEKEASFLHEQAAQWTDRARKVHSEDEGKALECVARMIKAQGDHHQVLSALEETRCLQQKMALDVDHILKKLEALKRRHQNLTGRQLCAEAVTGLQLADGGIQHDIDDLFTRWETDIVAQELQDTRLPAAASDPLAEEFETVEQKQALRLALEEIISNPSPEKEKKQ